MRLLTTTMVALTLLLGACGDDGDGGDGGSSYDTLTALNGDLAAADIECELEYEGLQDADREISQCVIDGEQAVLNVWFNDDLRQAVIDESGDTVAYGANWTIQVSSPEVAARLAEALDGQTGAAGS